ncbi:MAG: hypothetical protein ROZ64_18230 [Burkholderiaceae bacterium]|jgi:hypothetical protein|nr:hypothetical protein [Burkholderiaceae bacterium]
MDDPDFFYMIAATLAGAGAMLRERDDDLMFVHRLICEAKQRAMEGAEKVVEAPHREVTACDA